MIKDGLVEYTSQYAATAIGISDRAVSNAILSRTEWSIDTVLSIVQLTKSSGDSTRSTDTETARSPAGDDGVCRGYEKKGWDKRLHGERVFVYFGLSSKVGYEIMFQLEKYNHLSVAGAYFLYVAYWLFHSFMNL
jgi:hypothetical protein